MQGKQARFQGQHQVTGESKVDYKAVLVIKL